MPASVRIACCLLALTILTDGGSAQTTQGLISGRLTDSQSGQPVNQGRVFFSSGAGVEGTATAGADGYYILPLLSPGTYRIRATAAGYQPHEVQNLILAVAGRLELNVAMRPLNDVWESGRYRSVFLPGSHTVVNFYGPDVDTSRSGSYDANTGRKGALETTLSDVIDMRQLRYLPLSGRDTYAMLATQPGVAADSGTGRGLGLSINGQRPTASNYLLDGLENNNYLITGPLTTIAPEMVQEYRLSTSSYSPEYGRTGGFVANVVTHTGTNAFHGAIFAYLKNDALNGNEFQRNLAGIRRTPLKEAETGAVVTGPIIRNRLLFSTSFDNFRGRSRLDPVTYLLPTQAFISSLPQGSAAASLFSRFAYPLVSDGANARARVSYSPPASVDRLIAIQRFDYRPKNPNHQVMFRASGTILRRPDFVWTPYPDFVSALKQDTVAFMLGHTWQITPRVVNEVRLGVSDDHLVWKRSHPEVPALQLADGTTLPGAPGFYPYWNRNRTDQLVDNVMISWGRHLTKVGGGYLRRKTFGTLAAGREGQYYFQDLNAFAQSRPNILRASISRSALPAVTQPDYYRDYRYTQSYLFAQDSFRVRPRLTLNYGVRYENFGAPENVFSQKDALVQFGDGNNIQERLRNAKISYGGDVDQQLYLPDKDDWAGRFGFSWDLSGKGTTVLRGSYGLFYDRPFDNLWQTARNNTLVLSLFRLDVATPTPYLNHISTILPGLAGRVSPTTPPNLTIFQAGIKNPYVHSFFLGIQQTITGRLSLDVQGIGSQGRKLITTDVLNRQDLFNTIINPALPPNMSYRANQGGSSYYGLQSVLRYRAQHAQVQLSYTWSHSIDNQTEPLALDLFDYGFTSGTATRSRAAGSGFLRQFDSRGDRGNSDFDQRHNFTIFSVVDIPQPASRSWWTVPLRNWTISELAAFRTGFPLSPFGLFGRATLLDPEDVVLPSAVPVNGGVRLWDRTAFADPFAQPFTLGNTGRNILRGPGLYNVDISLARTFRFGETTRLILRGDAYNVLNHANLNVPDSNLLNPRFGEAQYGRTGLPSTFPSLSPLNESGRQLQLGLRFEF